MKLLITFLCLGLLHVSAETYGQHVSLRAKNTPLETIIQQLRQQTGYDFVADRKLVREAGNVNVQLHNATIDQALQACLKGKPISYHISEGIITLVSSHANSLKNRKLPLVEEGSSQQAINGRVTDTLGNSLASVTLMIRGSTRGSSTDEEGGFTIQAQVGEVLDFSLVGYQTVSLTIASSAALSVVLRPESADLDEVVVVAYGTQKKETVTGAISSIRTKEIKQSPAANLAVTLAGRLPGLTSVQTSGEPGRDITQLFIRGQGTINAQSPIILVDGVERDLTYIDPNEVESVTILKDASSTALFGVRGANGVILVTTRRGQSEVPEINFSTEAGVQGFTRFITPVNSFEFATLRNLARQNDGLDDEFSPETVERYRNGEDPLRYPNTNWRDILVKDNSLQQRYNLNVSGAGKAMKYFVNAGYLNQGGQFKVEKDLPYDPSFKLDRYNFRSNIDLQLNKSLKAFLNVAGYLEKQNMPTSILNRISGDYNGNLANMSAVEYIISLMYDLPSNVPGPLTPDGEVVTAPSVDWPAYGLLNRTGYIQQSRTNVTATYGMEQRLDFITQGLGTRAVLSFDTRSTNNLFASRNFAKYVQVIDPNIKGADGRDSVYFRQYDNFENTPLSISGGRFYNTLSNLQASIDYARSFGGHRVTGLLLYQQQTNRINEELPYKLLGLASRITYGFKDTYFLELNAGYNGSEQFAKGRRFGFFPAVSAAWLISNEPFFESVEVINTLKVRGSYGEVGNDRIGGRRFLYLDNVQVNGGGYSASLGNGQFINTQLLKNEELQWEVSRKSNIGVEIGLLNSINLIVDVFHEKRNNILRNRGTVPTVNGLPVSTLPPVNIGVVENQGYEIELNYNKRFGSDFSILSKLNLNYAANRQLFADEPMLTEDFAYRYRETGYAIGQPFGYIVEGYFGSEEEIRDAPVQNVGGHASRPGDFRYKDLNGDHIIDERDVAPIGHAGVPQYTFGGAVSITYKQFDFSFLLQGVGNVDRFYGPKGNYATNNVKNYVSRHLQSWTEERVANGEPINYPRLTTQTSPNEIGNSFFIVDGSYLRLKNMELGYSLPEGIVGRIGAKRIRVYSNGLNLFTWDKLPTKEFDPEISNWSSYPITKLFNFGVNIVF